jgi:hypothetical protein
VIALAYQVVALCSQVIESSLQAGQPIFGEPSPQI